ncbi:MAG: hypothetical protein KJ600_01945 [Nanoarchaeota archaeon]|nr:hypothetical protein [Nanoarchaeota archaeon]
MAKENKKVLIALLLGVCVVLIALSVFLNSSKPIDVKEFDVKFIVDVGGIGIDVDTSVLTFGQVNPGGGGKRTVVIDNSHDFPVEVKVLVSKNLLGLIDTNSSFVVDAGKNVSVPVKLNVPQDFELGNYTGKIKFEMYEIG